MIASTLLVDTAVGRILPSLPAGTQYNVRRMDPTVFPIISYALVSDTADPAQLQDFARLQITPLLSSITGLAKSVCRVATPRRSRCSRTRNGSQAMAWRWRTLQPLSATATC